MHLVRHTDAPMAETVLFHLTLFGEFCETLDADASSVAIALECLRDAVDELCRSSHDTPLSLEANAAVETALHQAEATFRAEMPEHFARTNASRGLSALRDLIGTPVGSERCCDREKRSTAMANADRFGKTLSAFLVTLQSEAARRDPRARRARRLPGAPSAAVS